MRCPRRGEATRLPRRRRISAAAGRCRRGDQQDRREDQRRADRAEAEAAVVGRLGQQIAEGRAERARQHERDPEQQHAIDAGQVHGGGGQRDRAADQRSAAEEAESGIVGEEVAERGAERVGEQDRQPVEQLRAARADRVDGKAAFDEPPDHEHGGEAGHQDRGAARVAEAERAIHEVRHGRAGGAGRQDHRPVQQRVEAAGGELRRQRGEEEAEQDQRTQRVADVQGHRQQVAGRLAERRRADLHDPERERDLRDFACRHLRGSGGFLRSLRASIVPCHA